MVAWWCPSAGCWHNHCEELDCGESTGKAKENSCDDRIQRAVADPFCESFCVVCLCVFVCFVYAAGFGQGWFACMGIAWAQSGRLRFMAKPADLRSAVLAMKPADLRSVLDLHKKHKAGVSKKTFY